MNKLLIGIHAKPRSGKDTVANYLIKKYFLHKYGSSVPVKYVAAAMFNVPIENFNDDLKKDTIDPFWGITYRQMAQKVGKECSRDIFGENFWLRHIERVWESIQNISSIGGMILADIRYENEVNWVHEHGGKVIFIKRDNLPVSSGSDHAAEAGLSEHLADVFINNNGTITDLYHETNYAIDFIKEMVQWKKSEIPEGACCAYEKRNMNGGCDNCGDPCL